MKKSELIALIADLPNDAEIVVNGYNCDILGEYLYSSEIVANKDVAYIDKHGSLHQRICNRRFVDDKPVEVFVLVGY